MALPSVEGKIAIVTGAGSGICLAFASLLLSRGCHVLFADLTLRPEAQQIVDEYSSSNTKGPGSPRAVFQQTDVRSWTQLERMFSTCEAELGPADIVCPGAGVYEPAWSSFWVPPGTTDAADPPSGDRYASFDILISHPVRTTQLAISHFIKHKKPGSVVHVSSIAAQLPSLLVPLYNTAKAGLSAFVRSMAALEIPPEGQKQVKPIRVTAVAPGIIKTPIWTENPDKMKWLDVIQDQWVTPEDVAEVMYDLVVKEEHVGGTILEVAKDSVRRVELLNDPGPGTKAGVTVSGVGTGIDEVWDRLGGQLWSSS